MPERKRTRTSCRQTEGAKIESRSKALSLFAQFFCAFCGGSHSGHDCIAQAAQLKNFDAGHGGTPWTGNHLAKFGRMQLGLTNHLSRAHDSLNGEFGSNLARKSHHHSTVCKGLDKSKHVSRSASAQTCNSIQGGFAKAKYEANRSKQGFGDLGVSGQCMVAEGIGGGSLFD